MLRTTDETMAGVALNRWREGGLDVPDWVKARYGVEGAPLWKSCPFLPHAGFGEVAIDLVCHTKKPPGGSRP